ncbi:hypothetical protein BB559_006009 [Furculomyces boomerangus]|uniref:ABC transporter domain-containing protein n=2 Tax=Harpellales TaxID=61421 RepID=A0A2T9Y1E2_9FUNG|nr:hypothetical protein BB559_006649 [Furculomyces boomerangus]PVU87515.1 hypothetical protein BB559_006009 [Furculomyces boomerangus]PWA00388.1 hypothetical protein BB558_003549 [Smittium angustum]
MSETQVKININQNLLQNDQLGWETYQPLLEIDGLEKHLPNGDPIIKDFSFSMNNGEILVITGKSGIGKTTLLRCISQLASNENGVMALNLNGQKITPESHGIPYWRTEVMYVPQRPPQLEGTPMDLYRTVSKLKFQKDRRDIDPISLSEKWSVDAALWERNWSSLSGGEQQRIALSIAVSRNPTILLLDEPTSMLDPVSTVLVENSLLERKNIIWITHDHLQGSRVSSRTLELTGLGNYNILKNTSTSSSTSLSLI